jgi:hypothetical protein
MENLRRLGDRLDVIEVALSVALNEPAPEHRGRMLTALNAATETVRAEHTHMETAEQDRSCLRLISSREEPAAASPTGPTPDRTPARVARSARW